MDYFLLDENENYQTQCGVMFFTNKGRLIYHCTLCNNKKFDLFNLFQTHLKEHILMFPIDEQLQAAETSPHGTDKVLEDSINRKPSQLFPVSAVKEEEDLSAELALLGTSQLKAVRISEDEFKAAFNATDNQSSKNSLVKQEEDLLNEVEQTEMHEALMEEEMPLSEIKKRKRLHLKTGVKIVKTEKKIKTSPKANPKSKQTPTNYLDENVDITKLKEPTPENLEIPKVAREVKTRLHPRSALTTAEERKHKCPVCGAAFKDKHNMIHHLKRHTDNKDHKCTECDKRFYTTSEVRVHMRSHNKDERSFLCSLCGRSYVSNSHLSEHLKRHFNQRNYKCDICEKAFYDKKLLKTHMAGHSNDRPFPCNICTASFKRKIALSNHLKLHENKREFKCELCNSGFNQRAGLFSHMKTAHK